MKKQLQLILSATFMALAGLSTYGQSIGDQFDVDGIKYEITATTTTPAQVEIVGYDTTNFGTNVTIPPTTTNQGTDYQVTAIRQGAFHNKQLTGLIFSPQSNVTRIGKDAFKSNSLTSVEIPNSVTIMEQGAFDQNGLTSVKISENITRIEQWVFAANDLREVSIPAKVEHIGKQAFFANQNLGLVTMNRNPPTTQEVDAFQKRTGVPGLQLLDLDLVVPSGSIQAYENEGWTGFASITYGVTNLDGVKYGIVDDSQGGATVIGIDVRATHTAPFHLIIPEKVDIGGTLYDVTAIAENGLRNYWRLQTVTIPGSVKSIGAQAFYESPHMFRVTMLGNDPPTLAADAFEYPHRNEIDLAVPFGKEQDYINAGWTNFKGVSSLEGRFHRNGPYTWEVTSLSPNEMELYSYHGGAGGHVEIPSEIPYLLYLQSDIYSVTSIGRGVFKHRGIDSVTIPGAVTSVRDSAFFNNALININIPDAVTEIGKGAFQHNDLGNLTIPQNVETIGANAFRNNVLTSVEISNSVTIMGEYAFANNQLTRVTTPANVKVIDRWVYKSNQLKEVTLSGNVTHINLFAFEDNPDLDLVTVEANDPPVIDENAFSNADRDQIDLVVPLVLNMDKIEEYLANGWDGFRSISYGIFTVDDIRYGITSLDEVVVVDYTGTDAEVSIPETVDHGSNTYTVTAIREDAFQNKGLTGVGIPNSVATIGERAFSDNQLTEVTLPGSVVSIGPQTFNNNPNLALVTVEANDPPVLDPIAFSNANRHQIDLVVPSGKGQAYKDNGWDGFRSILEKIGVSIEAPAETINLSSFTVTIRFDVDVTGFTMEDIDLVNATADHFTGSGSTYIVEITPISCNGAVQIDVPENVTDMRNLPATATVTVVENPNQLVAAAKDITVQLDASGRATILPEDVDDGSAYGCTNVPDLSLDIDTFDCSHVGTPVTVTLTATQGTESAMATALVTVEENPLVANTKDIIVELGANGQATILPEDVDDGSAYGCDGTPELSLDIDTFDCSHVGTPVTVTLTATHGTESAMATAVVTVENTINSLVAVAQDIIVQLDADGMAFISPEQIDNGSGSGCNSTGAISLSLDRTLFTCDDVGMASVVLTARQGSETATATATVTVEAYLSNLVAMAKDIIVQLDASGQATIAPEDVDDGSAYDGCGSTPDLSLDKDTFDCEDVGTPVTVTLTATHGTDTATATATVTVEAGSNCGTGPVNRVPLADFNKGFSPNGDGIADTLEIQGLEAYTNNVVKIYDLSQRLLFSAHYSGPEDAWDGTHENGMVPVGTYVCVIDYNEPGLGHEAKMIYVNY